MRFRCSGRNGNFAVLVKTVFSGGLFLVAPFPGLCLLVPFYSEKSEIYYRLSSFSNQCLIYLVSFR